VRAWQAVGVAVWTNLVRQEASRPTRTSRTKTFTERHHFLGPTVWILGIVYFIVQLVVAMVWRPSYSWTQNTISDLGNTACTERLCSPRHAWMNAEFFVLGFVMAAGSLLIYQEFSERGPEERLAARLGFSCIAIAGVGAAVVGWFPENTVSLMHIIGAATAIGVGTAGILVLGLVLSLPSGLSWTMRVVAPVAISALVFFALHVHLGLGAGTIERLAAYPETIWLIVFGIYISHDHYQRARYRKRAYNRRAERICPPDTSET
jgi:hypothetical membrane protein